MQFKKWNLLRVARNSRHPPIECQLVGESQLWLWPCTFRKYDPCTTWTQHASQNRYNVSWHSDSPLHNIKFHLKLTSCSNESPRNSESWNIFWTKIDMQQCHANCVNTFMNFVHYIKLSMRALRYRQLCLMQKNFYHVIRSSLTQPHLAYPNPP